MNLSLAAAFTVSHQAVMAAGPVPVNLKSAGQFTILSGAGITTAGQAYNITGNVGTSPAAGSYEIDLVKANVTGIIYEVSAGGPAGAVVDPTLLTAAKGGWTAAYNDAAGRVSTPTAPLILNPGTGGNIGGLTLAPGLYKFTTSPASITGSDVTLKGGGGASDVWIFQVAAGLTVGNGIRVILTDGAQAGNIFWQVGTTATIGTGAAFNGTIMAHAAVTMASTSTMTGRALAGTAVTFDGSSITLPSTVTQDYGTIVLVTNGYGTIQHGVWPTNMVIGSHYTVRAVPAPENVFSNWVGGTAQPYSVLSTSASYTFVMQSNLTLEANIVTNPFIPITGIYNGLFTTPGGVTEQTAGMLERLTVDKKGTYSGTLLINGGSHVVSGRFDLSGQATNKIARLQSQGGPLLVEMALNRDNFPLQVTGTVSGTNDGVPWVANLMADLAANSLSSAEYTMLLPPDTNNTPPTLSPGGDGYALITNHQSSVKNPDAA